MKIEKVTLMVGQRVFVTPVDKVLKRSMLPVTETKISKIGTKYFYLERFDKIKFLISDINYPIGDNTMVKIHFANPSTVRNT